MTTKGRGKQRAKQERILDELAKLGGGVVGDDDVVFAGTQISLPETMDLGEAVSFLKRKQAADEEETRMATTFDFRPWDGAYAAWNVMRQYFGAAVGKKTITMFGSSPPSMITIKVGINETVEVPWGMVEVPGLERGAFSFGVDHDDERGRLFSLEYYGPRKHRPIVQGFFKAVQNELENNSIYFGKAFDGREDPDFIDLSGVDPAKVVYSQSVFDQLDANVWSLIENTETMRKLDLPLKRAVLFEGPYGTGKSLAAMLTAQKAEANGWTFIMCRPGRDSYRECVATARCYSPAVVFIEDVDTVSSTSDNDEVAELLDVFDGIQSKGTEILLVLTTNHVHKIHRGMMRPGRIDGVIRIDDLDPDGIRKLFTVLVADKLQSDINWPDVVEAVEGFQPAFIAEAANRAIRYSIVRGETDGLISTSDLVKAAEGLRPQLELMASAEEGSKPPTIETAFVDLVGSTVSRHSLTDPYGSKIGDLVPRS